MSVWRGQRRVHDFGRVGSPGGLGTVVVLEESPCP